MKSFVLGCLGLTFLSLGASPAALAEGLPPEWTLAGQEKTCAGGAQERAFTLVAREHVVPVGMGYRADVMALDGVGTAPIIEACEGDRVTLTLRNEGKMAHGIDSHAFFVSPERFGPVDSGGTLSYSGVMKVPGTFMFHCASGATTDVHIKSGMFGAMIVYPRKPFRRATEIAVLQGGFWGEPSGDGLIEADTNRIMQNNPFTLAFNGRLEHDPVHAHAGDLVRVYFVNAGPGASSVHVMGTMLDRFYDSGNPADALRDVQTGLVPAGSGATFELRLPEKGMYMLVDHDNLRFLPLGMGIGIMAD